MPGKYPTSLNPIGPNCTELEYPNGTRVLFSYKTAVAAYVVGRGLLRTSKKYSATTSRHVSKWLDGRNAIEVPPIELELILSTGGGTERVTS